MRHLFYGVLIGLVLTAPAMAQPASATTDSKGASSASQDQATKGGKQPATQPTKASQPAPPTAKDDSIANYDVNGSNASDAMGAGSP